MKHTVGDHVVMSKKAQQENNTSFITGVVRKIGDGWMHKMISVKRDGYKGHEYTWWGIEDWRKLPKYEPGFQSGKLPDCC